MPSRKRTRQDVESDDEIAVRAEPALLDRIRNTSEFAALMQFLFLFGKALKVPDISIEDFEQQCLLPSASPTIAEIGLALLKNISSHRGLTLEIFDEYTRRQYVAKAPHRNPFGTDEEAAKFVDFDIFTKIRVLHQLTIWTFWNPDRMRDKFADLHFDHQAADWRINPYGWDAEGRIYFLLDDHRLYRQTDPPIPEPIRKKMKLPAKGSRASKRRRLSRVVESTPETEDEPVVDTTMTDVDKNDLAYEENFDGRKWECVAVSYDDFQALIGSFKKSRHPDERTLCKRLENEMMPLLNKKEEERQRHEQRRQKELATLQMLAGAKRSSRLANKAEHQRELEIEQETERKRLAELKMAQKEQEKQQQLEQDRESRMQTREQRLREREVKRILHEEALRQEEEKLAQLAVEEAEGGPAGRVAHRQLLADMEKRQKELQDLQAEEDQWIFDCAVCGVHGQNLDDGTHSIACDKCNVWQHSACHNIGQDEAEREDFHFVCKQCKQKEVKSVPADQPAPPLNGIDSPVAKDIVKEKKPRKPKDPNRPRPNVKIIKKKDPKATSKTNTPAKTKAGAAAVNGSSSTSKAAVSTLTAKPLMYPRQPTLAPHASNGFINYTPGTQARSKTEIQPKPSPSDEFRKPSFPSFPPPDGRSTAQAPNGTQPNGSQAITPQVNGHAPPHVPYPSTPAQATNAGPSYAPAASSQEYPRTPSFAHSAAHALSSPAQHLTAASPTQHAPALGASESSMHGSSPGYSPTKHASPPPPRPSHHAHAFAGRDNAIKPPVALSPVSRPNITSPPIKRSPPPPAFGRPDALGLGIDDGALQGQREGASLQEVGPRQAGTPAPAVIVQNVSSNGQS